MRIHVFRPDYGEAGFTLPCPACGHEYDPGDWYFSRPCPRCGLDTDGDSLPWWVHSVVQGLRHRLGLPVERVREVHLGQGPQSGAGRPHRRLPQDPQGVGVPVLLTRQLAALRRGR
jgi:hypothetical protein